MRRLLMKGLLLFTIYAFIGPTSFAAINRDEITKLPGWDHPLPSKQYSGYLQVGTSNLHYWFVLSENNPATDPVVLWLNGGKIALNIILYLHLDRLLSSLATRPWLQLFRWFLLRVRPF